MIESDATHIFDGLDAFPTHVAHMRLGTFVTAPTTWPFPNIITNGTATRLYSIALHWLREDREYRRELEGQGRKRRGAKSQEVSIWASARKFTHILGKCSRLTGIWHSYRSPLILKLSIGSASSPHIALGRSFVVVLICWL